MPCVSKVPQKLNLDSNLSRAMELVSLLSCGALGVSPNTRGTSRRGRDRNLAQGSSRFGHARGQLIHFPKLAEYSVPPQDTGAKHFCHGAILAMEPKECGSREVLVPLTDGETRPSRHSSGGGSRQVSLPTWF